MPKYEYKALKDIDDKITNVMAKQNIQAYNSVEQAIKGRQNFYVTDTTFKGDRIMFKARIADHRVLRQWGKNFRNERRFLRTLRKADPTNPITKRMPHYINSQMTVCEWLMCEYIDQKTIGSNNISYDKPTKVEMLKIIDLLLDIQHFPIQEFCGQHRWTKNLTWMDFDKYHDIFHKFKRKKIRILKKVFSIDILEEADDIILSSKELLNGSCTLFCHGDFHPANIIIKDDAIGIDWETLHIDNAAFDITTLWFRMVDHPKERKFLLQTFSQVVRQRDFFPDLFRLNILCRMLEEISMIWYPLSQKEDLPDWQRELYQSNLERCKDNYLTAVKGGGLDDYK